MSAHPNQQGYDPIIRAEKKVSYVAEKAARNGSIIYTIVYSGLHSNVQKLIRRIRKGNPPPSVRGNRNGKSFENRDGDLPRDGDYREYSAPDPDQQDRGAVVLVHEVTHDNFYITPTHYRSVLGGRGKARDNPFYRVKEIPFQKIKDGGGDISPTDF